MNKSPINYLATTALGVVVWVVTAVFYGGSFSESLVYKAATPEQFLANFRIILGIAILVGIASCLYWYYYGSLHSTAADLNKAKKVWWVLFILQIIVSVGLLFTLIMLNLSEGIGTSAWLITYLLLSLLTWFFFWLCTYLMSPRTVKFIPLFK